MRVIAQLTLLTLGLSGATAALLAQAQPTDGPALIARMKSDLRNLVTAQERFYADSSTYTNVVTRLSFRPSDGVQLMMFRGNNRGWAGRAVHPSLPGRSCVIWVGAAGAVTPPRTDATDAMGGEGVPVCDELASPSSQSSPAAQNPGRSPEQAALREAARLDTRAATAEARVIIQRVIDSAATAPTR